MDWCPEARAPVLNLTSRERVRSEKGALFSVARARNSDWRWSTRLKR
jgi:hypothetical protein